MLHKANRTATLAADAHSVELEAFEGFLSNSFPRYNLALKVFRTAV